MPQGLHRGGRTPLFRDPDVDGYRWPRRAMLTRIDGPTRRAADQKLKRAPKRMIRGFWTS